MTFGARLKKAREKANITQADIAERVGVTQMMFSFYENGHKVPSLATAIEISKVLGTSLDNLCGLEGDKD